MSALDAGTLLDEIAAAVRAAGDRPFLRLPSGGTMTYRDLDDVSARVASGLLGLGLSPGDRVAISAPNRPEWLALFFGATRIGLTVVTLNPRYRETELDYMLNHSGAKAVVTVASLPDFDFAAFYAGFRDRIPGVEHVILIDGEAEGMLPFERLETSEVSEKALREAESGVHEQTPAVILYTSGTTGRPKGAVLTHGSMLASARAQAQRIVIGPDDVILGVMPLNHVGGITSMVLASLVSRSSVALQPAFDPHTAARAVTEYGITVFGGVPTMYTLVFDRAELPPETATQIRVALVGGANADPSLCAAIAEHFPAARLVNIYGLTEVSGGCVLSAPDDDLATVSRTLGTPIAGYTVRVVDDDGKEVPYGVDGELQVRGAGVAAGYWEMPDETARTFLPGGWFVTGDMGVMEPSGHLALRGRKKEMFVQGGYNVYPVEVENVLTAHPAVALAAGIGVPDPVLGEVGRYYVVPREGAPASPDELIGFCRERLADYKVPKQLEIVAELPFTPAGKIAKARLREEFTARPRTTAG
jgi:acyl-CoA synthetase (AMP-forming)/AMP-acid ligase II